MINSVSHWFSRHPYGITSIVFIIIVLLGWRMLGWGERQLGFLLLLYFIIALGIRLDDISRALGGSGGNPRIVRGNPKASPPSCAKSEHYCVKSRPLSTSLPAETMPMSVENYRASEPP